MNFLPRFALVSWVSLTLTGAALAAPPTPLVAVPQAGKADVAKTPVAKPLSAWLVGPSQASAFDAKDHPEEQGCLMVTEFDNGMIVGIHARSAGIVGMTVDTKAKNMTPGETRTVGFNVGQDAYVMNAVASDDSTLSLSLDEAGGGRNVVERLTGLGNFRLMIDEKPYYFATTGFTDGLARLQACMGGMMAVPIVVTGPGDTAGKVVHEPIETMKVTSSGHATPLALAMPNLVPSGYKFVLDDVDPMTPVDWQAGDDWVQVMRTALEPHNLKMAIKDRTIRISQRIGESDPVIEDEQFDDQMQADATGTMPADMPIGVWGGAKGERLENVLEAWGLMAGVHVKADLQGDLKLPRDVRYEGRFDEAVDKLLAQFKGGSRPTGMFRGLNTAKVVAVSETVTTQSWKPRSSAMLKAIKKETVTTKQMSTIPDPPGAPKKVDSKGKSIDKTASVKSSAKLKTGGTWKALEGTSLRDVLEHWGQDAGVEIVWLAGENYPLPESVSKKGEFEEAVMSVLTQYEGQGVRPTAQLNKDPDTGARALIIKSRRG